MMTFGEAWDSLAIGSSVRVRDGTPPPGEPGSGAGYSAWQSHNFEGVLEAKTTEHNWRYMRFRLPDGDTPDEVSYLAFSVADGPSHTFEVVA